MGTPLGPDDPERIGEYWLAARLGAGGQGVVYEAYDVRGARVALKALHRGSEDWVRERFGREADAARKVASFCTARILDVSLGGDGDGGGVPFIVSEYVPGPTLAEQVRGHGTLGPDALLRLATGAATALAAIHHADVIHRDLKPGNILLGPDGPRIIDFGIARAPDMSLTATGALLGTLGYMAPEVLAGKRATAASDIFAWGAVVLYAASATEPFRGENLGEVAHRTANLDPDLSSIPPRIRPLIAAALAKEPGLRPSASELVLGLVGDLPQAADPRQALLEAGVRRASTPAEDAADAAPSLGERAETAFTALPPDAQLAAQQLLLRTVVPGEAADGSQDSVRTVDAAEWYADRPESEQRPARLAVERLTEAGALTGTDDGSVRPASTALLPAWRRLHDWIAADRPGLALHRTLGRAARIWAAGGERTDDLLHGSALSTCLDWLPTAPFQLRPNPLEVRFLAAAQSEAARTARRRRQLLAGLATLTVLALLGGLFGVFQARESSRQRETAELRRSQATARSVAQAAESLRSTEPDTALLLSLAAWDIAEVPEARAALGAGATQRALSTVALPRVTDEAPGAGEVLLGSADSLLSYRPGSAEIWDLAKGAEGARKPRVTFAGGLTHPQSDGPPPMSPDGRFLLAWQKGSTYRLVSTRDGKPTGPEYTAPSNTEPKNLSNDGHVVFGDNGRHTGEKQAVLLTPEGRRLAEWTTDYDTTLSPDGSFVTVCEPNEPDPLQVWSITPTRLVRAFTVEQPGVSGPSACTTTVGFSTDGRRMLVMDSSSGGIPIWDTAKGTSIHSVSLHPTDNDAYQSVQLSGDGQLLFGWSNNGDLKIVDVASDLAVLDIPGVKDGANDGNLIDGAVLDERTKTVAYRSTRGNEVIRLDVSAVLSAGAGTEYEEGLAVSPDGTVGLVRLGLPAEAYQLVDLTTGKPKGARVRVPLPQFEIGIPNGPQSLSAEGRYFAHLNVLDGPKQVVTIRDTKENRKVWDAPVPGARDLVTIGLSPDGRYVSFLHEGAGVASGEGGDLEVWDTHEKKRVHRFRQMSGPAAFSPDSRTLVTGRGDVLDLASKETRKVPGFDREPTGHLAYAPDGKSLAVLKESGWLELWDGQVRERTARMPSSTVQGGTHYGQITRGLVFSPDGRFLAAIVGQTGGAAQLWDLDSRSALGRPLDLTGSRIDALGFRDDSILTLVGTRTNTLNLDPDQLAKTICKKAGRDITKEEWQLYVPDTPYRSVC